MEKGPSNQGPPPAYEQQQYPPQQYPPQQYPPQQYPPQQYPPQQYPPQQPQYQQPVVQQPPVTQVIVTTQVSFHQSPVVLQCPHCHQQVTTSTHEKVGVVPWLICGGLILLGCWLGCCIIPFCIKDLKDVEHKCPNCHHVVGKYKLL